MTPLLAGGALRLTADFAASASAGALFIYSNHAANGAREDLRR
jgi:hypothetical protein